MMHLFSLRFGFLLVFLLIFFQGQIIGEIAETKPVVVTDILEQASKLTESINNEDFIEGCCIAQRWKLDTFVKIAAIQANIKDNHGLELTSQRAIRTSEGKSVYAYYLSLLTLAQAKTDDKTGMSRISREALLAARGIKNITPRESVLEMIAQAEAEIGELDIAMKIADEITDKLIQSMVLENIAVNQKNAGDKKNASVTIDRAYNLVNSISDPIDRTSGLRNIASAQAKIGFKNASKENLKIAKLSAESITEGKIKTAALIGIAEVQLEFDDKDGCKETLERALLVTHTINDESDQSHFLASISHGFLNLGDRRLFEQTIHEALSVSDAVKDGYNRSAILLKIAHEYGNAKDTENKNLILKRAFAIALEIENENLKNYLILEIASTQIKAGNLEDGEKTIEKIKDHTIFKPQALFILINAEVNARNLEKASILTQSLSPQSNIIERSEALQKIAEAKSAKGEIISTIVWANNLNTPYEKVRALLGIAEGISNQ